MQSFIEDPFWNEQETINFLRVHCVQKSHALFFFFSCFFFRECKHSKADNVTPFNSFFFVENKSIEYLQNLVNFEIKTVHLNLHWKWGLV